MVKSRATHTALAAGTSHAAPPTTPQPPPPASYFQAPPAPVYQPPPCPRLSPRGVPRQETTVVVPGSLGRRDQHLDAGGPCVHDARVAGPRPGWDPRTPVRIMRSSLPRVATPSRPLRTPPRVATPRPCLATPPRVATPPPLRPRPRTPPGPLGSGSPCGASLCPYTQHVHRRRRLVYGFRGYHPHDFQPW